MSAGSGSGGDGRERRGIAEKFARTRCAESREALRNGRGGCGALLYERLVRRLPTRFPLFYLERGSTDHLRRDTEKSPACAIAPDLLEQTFWEMKDTSLKPRTTWDGGKII